MIQQPGIDIRGTEYTAELGKDQMMSKDVSYDSSKLAASRKASRVCIPREKEQKSSIIQHRSVRAVTGACALQPLPEECGYRFEHCQSRRQDRQVDVGGSAVFALGLGFGVFFHVSR
jgi:hypothetical protein